MFENANDTLLELNQHEKTRSYHNYKVVSTRVSHYCGLVTNGLDKKKMVS